MKLLRVLQERTFRRVGDNEPREFGGRIVAATHRDLSTLREDFVQRLKTHMVEIPPLRERLGDLGVLVEHFLAKAAIRFFKKKPTVPEHLYGYLENYDFPGNVRELENIVSDAVAQHRRGVMPIDLFLRRIEEKRGSRPREAPAHSEKIVFPHPMPTLNEIDLSAVLEAMRRTGDNKTAAARILGVARATVIRVLQRANSAKKLEREPPNDGDESG